MPTYEYACPDCGPFEAMRSMAEYQAPHPCPECGTAAPRAGVSAPGLMGMDAGRRHAMATNERSANAPARASRAHPSSCGCCKPGAGTLKAESVPAAKGSPGRRPWMIGH